MMGATRPLRSGLIVKGRVRGLGRRRYVVRKISDTMGGMTAQPDKQPSAMPKAKPRPSKAVKTPLTADEKQRAIDEMIERRKSVYDALAK